jgi:hypothetical protein
MAKPSPEPALPSIRTIRRLKVVADADLAALFGVSTKVFNQAVRRNAERFPDDFAFQVTIEELEVLRSQIATLKPEGTAALRSQIVTLKSDSRGRHTKYRPWVFTEHGAIMAAMLLRSEHAVAMSVYVVRAFVALREQLASNRSVLRRIAEIDKKLIEHDVVLSEVVKRLQPLLNPPAEPAKPKIGFHRGNR